MPLSEGFCVQHWSQISKAVIDAGLLSHVAGTEAEFKKRMRSPDPIDRFEPLAMLAYMLGERVANLGIVVAPGSCQLCAAKDVEARAVAAHGRAKIKRRVDRWLPEAMRAVLKHGADIGALGKA